MTEIYYSGENTRQTFAFSEQPGHLYDQLREVFPWVNKENYFSISTPSYHEILDEVVVTCCLPRAFSVAMFGDSVVLTTRKFCMESVTSYIRPYYLHMGDSPDWLPEGCTLMFYTENVPEYGRPFNEKASTFADYYFRGDLDTVEAHFDLPRKRGDDTTFYGVTIVNGAPLRVKQYCYDEPGTFDNWNEVYDQFMEAGGSCSL